jgi:diaminopimelate epimerase
MGAPSFAPAASAFDATGLAPRVEDGLRWWPLELDARAVWVAVVSMGNPHAVQIVDDIELAAVGKLGPAIEHHTRFAQRVNAGFVQVIDRRTVRLRVWERGAGETLACGTGACAAAVAGIASGHLDSPVRVLARGGALRIAWAGEGARGPAPVLMTGAATKVFDGEIDIE